MICQVCGSSVQDDEEVCPSCGLPRSDMEPRGGPLSETTEAAIRDVHRVVRSVQRTGDVVAEASVSVARAAKVSSATAADKAWTVTKMMVAEGEHAGDVAADRLLSEGRVVREKAQRVSHRARSTARKIGAKSKTVRRKAGVARRRTEEKVRAVGRKVRSAARHATSSR